MNVPLDWLKEYVQLPTSEKELTDKLTMIGHMLDKRKEVAGSVVVDLELRGNRADMFGIIGVARDVSAVFNTPLRLPKVAKLPKTDTKSPLVKADSSIGKLVKRYIAVRLDVVVKPSPKWLADRLTAYGIEPLNNVVDVTNYVMVETSHPMHAFDAHTLKGSTLYLRMAKAGEKFETIQQGTTVKLTTEDIAICDKNGVQCLTCIGGARTKVTEKTTTIILETAVYDAASCRRTARRHKINTEGGGRHEKHQDPTELPFTLARAIQILQDIADAKVTSDISDYYPAVVKSKIIEFHPATITRLVGITIPHKEIITILQNLACVVHTKNDRLMVTVPTFRTDIEQEADLVEEVVRIYGYEKIPVETLSGALPRVGTPAHILFENNVRHILQNLQVNEVITSTLIEGALIPTYEQTGVFPTPITLVNAPDSAMATLRPTLLANLVNYAKRSIGFRQRRIALYEIGKTYHKEKKRYQETNMLGIVLHGEMVTTSWNKQPRSLTIHDLTGILQGVLENVGLRSVRLESGATHPSLDPDMHGSLVVDDKVVGSFGRLHPNISQENNVPTDLFVAELSLSALASLPIQPVQPYVIAPAYPPIMEDITFTVSDTTQMGKLIETLQSVDALIQKVELVDVYKQNRSVRITYSHPDRTLTSDEIRPIHDKLVEVAKATQGATVSTLG